MPLIETPMKIFCVRHCVQAPSKTTIFVVEPPVAKIQQEIVGKA